MPAGAAEAISVNASVAPALHVDLVTPPANVTASLRKTERDPRFLNGYHACEVKQISSYQR